MFCLNVLCFHPLLSNIMHFFYREMRSERSYLALVSSETEILLESTKSFAGLLALLFWE